MRTMDDEQIVEVAELEGADGLIDLLMPRVGVSPQASVDQWIYRGHEKTNYELLASAPRSNSGIEQLSGLNNVWPPSEQVQRMNEVQVVLQFQCLMNQRGLPWPGGASPVMAARFTIELMNRLAVTEVLSTQMIESFRFWRLRSTMGSQRACSTGRRIRWLRHTLLRRAPSLPRNTSRQIDLPSGCLTPQRSCTRRRAQCAFSIRPTPTIRISLPKVEYSRSGVSRMSSSTRLSTVVRSTNCCVLSKMRRTAIAVQFSGS